MPLSIRAWTIIVLNVFVITASLVLGWIAQDAAGRVVEERLTRDTVRSVSSFLTQNSFPVSDSMLGYLRQMLDSDWVALDASPSRVAGSSLSEAATMEFVRQHQNKAHADVIELGGIRYRVDAHEVSSRITQAGSGSADRRLIQLFVLIPESRFQEARTIASHRVAGMIIPATALATLLAAMLAFLTTRPIRRLTHEMQRLDLRARDTAANIAHHEATSDGKATDRASADLRQRLSTRGPLETRHLAVAFYELIDRLAAARRGLAQHERLATLGKVSLSVAHELRNPLSGIKMNMRVLQDRIQPAGDPVVGAIVREIDRMSLYLDELMSLAPASGRMKSVRAPGRMSESAESVLTLLEGRCRHAKIAIIREYPADEPMVSLDSNQIRQAIMNLLVNAIEAMPTGGTITVAVRVRDASVVVEVTDSGPGVQADGMDIFDAFETGKSNGVGLGLYLTRQIVVGHGGRIGYENKAHGALFWFALPIQSVGREPVHAFAHTSGDAS